MQRHAWFSVVPGIEPRALCMPGKDSSNQAISLVQSFWVLVYLLLTCFLNHCEVVSNGPVSAS